MTMYNGTLNITTDGAVIGNMVINGDIVVNANNVTVKNVVLNSKTINEMSVGGA